MDLTNGTSKTCRREQPSALGFKYPSHAW
uniref:Uncharacterized protein n=1 Tax=Arundo donax TaxID=35708 RepID=A0A0A9APC9_ARUDO